MESELQNAEKSVTMNGLHYTFIITHLSLHISNNSNSLSSTDKVRRQNLDTKRLFIGEKARAKQESKRIKYLFFTQTDELQSK